MTVGRFCQRSALDPEIVLWDCQTLGSTPGRRRPANDVDELIHHPPYAHYARRCGFELRKLTSAINVPAAVADQRGACDSASFSDMATTVLRVRLIGGDRLDITYAEPDVSDADQLVEHAISTLAQDSGVLRTKHGDRLVVLYGRGVAAIEVAPRGAVL